VSQLPLPDHQWLSSHKVSLKKPPRHRHHKTIIFDLDETLIHCNENDEKPSDIQIPITFPTGDVITACVNIRPYAREILKSLSEHFEVIVFTASHSCYANKVLDWLDP